MTTELDYTHERLQELRAARAAIDATERLLAAINPYALELESHVHFERTKAAVSEFRQLTNGG